MVMHPSCYRCSSEWGWRNSAPVRSGLRVVTQPVGEQITLAEAKQNCRVESYPDLTNQIANFEDADFLDWIIEAREHCENETGRALVPQTFELTTGAWPTGVATGGELILPMSPISGVTSVIYLDSAGAPVTLAANAYTLGNWSDWQPTWLFPAVDVPWPTAQGAPNAITVRYTAGYTLPNGSPNDRPLPKLIRRAMFLYINDKFERRGDETEDKVQQVTLGIDALLRKYKLDIGIA